MKQSLAKRILDRWGWETIGSKCHEKNVVILEAPHTSLWDFVVGYLYYESVGGHLSIMAKKELFFWPLGPILRAMGAFPIDRSNPSKTILSVVHEMENNKDREYHMVLCPEGTRKPVSRWKTGYHTIAKGAGVPVYLSVIDWKNKKVGIFQEFRLGDNAREDTLKIQAIYRQMDPGAKHPENFKTE